jgi:hypothetical protein
MQNTPANPCENGGENDKARVIKLTKQDDIKLQLSEDPNARPKDPE